ncbi:MAG TPA: VCBS repeat-containing protein, partial [Phycisphaeraceae bacterium]|nr:VCBS repeat-containing protein [Phycisphaeraceae bacterium]
MHTFFTSTVLLAGLASAAVADSPRVQIMHVTDAASAVPGRITVSPTDASLPHSDPAQREIAQMPGFPVIMGLDGQGMFSPQRGVILADLNGDGHLEIIASSTDRAVYAWDYRGMPLPGFPVYLNQMAQYPPAVADMDGDGDLEIVQFTRGWTDGGRLYVLDSQGNILPGFPLSFSNNNVESAPALYDLDGDGVMEILAADRDYPIGHLHVVELDGSEWGGNWPVDLDHVPTGTPAVGDVDNDGDVEIFTMSYNSMYLLETDGSLMPGWPKQIPNANFSYQSAALADLDGDGDLEIVVGAHKDAAGTYVYQHDGSLVPGWPKLLGSWTYCPPTVTDLEGDGVLEILDGRAGGFSGWSNCFWAWDVYGNIKPGFPYGQSHGGGSEGPLTVADINGDGYMEIFADHNIMEGTQGYLFGVDHLGNDLPGFPLRPNGFTYMNGATIGDVDGDGDYELAVVSTHDLVA